MTKGFFPLTPLEKAKRRRKRKRTSPLGVKP